MSNVFCPECGFQNPETANFCARCGTLLRTEGEAESTMAFTPEDLESAGHELEDFGVEGPALVVRAGGGRAGETFPIERDEVTIGRSPDCDVFLDDVTVSRRHAVIHRADMTIEDLGSLNGTFLNRERIDKAQLADGDELQVGKYRLTVLR